VKKLTLLLGVPILLASLAVLLSFLYVVLLAGRWTPFLWSAGVFVGLMILAKLASLSFDPAAQLHASGMLWEIFGGVAGWAWMVLAVSSFGLFVWALFFGGSWGRFSYAIAASAVCKLVLRWPLPWKESAMFKLALVQRGMSKAEAQEAWIAEGQRRLSGETVANGSR
jgi:hypothetical protein